MTKLILYTDGASRGNPGPAAFGIVLVDLKGNIVEEQGETIGRMTNNEAEYYALLRGLEYAAEHHATGIEIRTDSELMARQLKRIYKVRAGNLKPLYDLAQAALSSFHPVTIAHIPRELNRRADQLANRALDSAGEA